MYAKMKLVTITVRDEREATWSKPHLPTIIQRYGNHTQEVVPWGPKSGSYIWKKTPPVRTASEWVGAQNQFADLPLNWIFCTRSSAGQSA